MECQKLKVLVIKKQIRKYRILSQQSGQEYVWNYIKELIHKRNLRYSKSSLGDMLGCAIASGEREQGKDRFWTIVISKATYIIWKVRCEWKISRNTDLAQILMSNEMEGRISTALEKKIKLNCPMTYAESFGQKEMIPSVVSSTWKNLLLASSMPLRLWRKITTVWVGIGQVLALGPTLCA